MFETIAKIGLKDAAQQSRLFSDYVSMRSDALEPFLSPIQSHASSRTELRPLDEPTTDGWHTVIDEISELSSRLGTQRSITDKLALARSRKARFVVTGQQPGVLGGPLYSFYKVVTAVALAARLEKDHGEPCIPLYWCGSDDADFAEVRDVSLVTGELAVVSASIATDAHRPGMPVGSVEKHWLERVWQSLRPFTEGMPGGGAASGIVDSALPAARDNGEIAMAVLLGLLGGSFAVVDGRSPAVRRFARSLFAEYVTNEREIKESVARGGEALERAGYHSQLSIGADSGVFLVDNGIRHSVTSEHRQVLEKAVLERVEECSPGVVLRNLVQDHVFEPAAVVLGPAEIAYRAQIASLYDRFRVTKPLAFPRLAATLVPPPLDELLSIDGMDAGILVSDPASFASAVYRSKTPRSLADSVAEFEKDVGRALARLSKQLESSPAGRTEKKLRGRLGDIEARVRQLVGSMMEIGKDDALKAWPFLGGLADLVKPADKPQERRIWSGVPLLFSSTSNESEAIAIAASFVDELLDGRWAHIVYSIRS